MLTHRLRKIRQGRSFALALTLLVLIFMFSALIVCGRQNTISLNDIDAAPLGWAAACYALFCIANAIGWTLILAALGHPLPSRDVVPLWIRCESLRWLPGSVWNFGARSLESRRRGVPQLIAATSMLLELFYSIFGRWLIVMAACAISAQELWTVACQITSSSTLFLTAGMGLAIILVAIATKRQEFVARYVTQIRDFAVVWRTRRNLWGKLLILQGYYFVISLLHGGALVLIVRCIHPHSEAPAISLIAANSAAWLVGFFAIFAPGGLVVREACLATILAYWYSPAEAVSIAVGWRMLQIVIEAGLLVVVLMLNRRRLTDSCSHSDDIPLATTCQH